MLKSLAVGNLGSRLRPLRGNKLGRMGKSKWSGSGAIMTILLQSLLQSALGSSVVILSKHGVSNPDLSRLSIQADNWVRDKFGTKI